MIPLPTSDGRRWWAFAFLPYIPAMPLLPRRIASRLALVAALALIAYLALWPVPIAPVAWDAPADRGFVGDFAVDSSLAGAERIPLDGHPGPESVARDAEGRLYAASLDGSIVRLDYASPRQRGATPALFASRTFLGSERGDMVALTTIGVSFRWVRKQ